MLDDRKAAILRAVVQQYIETAQPVGSNVVAGRPEVSVSSATVRNDMNTLEREGYLVQPHTSAGRIPTEKGYRFFVDHLEDTPSLSPTNIKRVREFFSAAHGELESMLAETSRLLANITTATAVVVGEPEAAVAIRSVQLVELGPRLALAVVILGNGVVTKHHLELADPVAPDTLEEVGRRVREATVGQVPGAVTSPAPSGDATVDRLAAAVTDAVRGHGGPARRVFVDGASNMAGAIETRETLRQILGLLEQQFVVVTLVRDLIDRGLNVAIGSETGVEPLAECSLVVAPYTVGGEVAGTIGVLGPTRMNYSETLAAVAAVSRRLSSMLTEG